MEIISRFRLDGNFSDSFGRNVMRAHEVALTAEGGLLNGVNGFLQIADHPSLRFGDGDFFLGLWVRFPENYTGAGDLFSKFDEKSRTGLNFTVAGSSGGYTAMSDSRSLFFGL
ncbi:MAG: hypothetical protein FWE69_08940, partial [Clostridiales bacterium]|nr:hypothetical protein [Clostridiales bacterium]